MQPNGASKNIVDQAIFSKDGPNLNNPEETKIPKVIPKIYLMRCFLIYFILLDQL